MAKVEFEFPDPDSEDEGTEIEIEPSNMRVLGEKAPDDEVVEDEVDEVVDEIGDDLDIEVVDDTPDDDKGRTVSEAPEDVTEEELQGYSEKVRKRISKFTKGYHDERRAKEEAQRERGALENYARSVLAENEQLKAAQGKSQAAILDQAKRASKFEMEQAESEYLDAHASGDSQKLLDAQNKLTTAKMRADKIASIKLPSLQESVDTVQSSQATTTEGQPAAPAAPQVDKQASTWAEENTWFGEDEEMTGFALVVHNKLVKSGVSPQSDEYYEQINARMRQVFPDNFEEAEGEQPAPRKKKSQVVAPATRSTKSKSIKLKKSEVAIAKRLGVPLEDYAKQVAVQMRKDENG